MKAATAKAGALTLLTVLSIGLSAGVDAAEKGKFKWMHTGRVTISETKSTPVPDYELVQGTYADPIKSESTKFDMIDSRIVNQDETISGNGKHRGIEIDIFRNGDTATQRYEGTHKVTTKEGGAWEVNYEGKFEYISGTGRFKNIKGGGTYRGRVTPDSLTEQDEADLMW